MTGRTAKLALALAAALATTPPAAAATLKAGVADTTPQTRALYLQLIRQARLDGRARAAIAYLDDFDQRYPGDVQAGLLRINSLLDLGQTDRAAAILAELESSKAGTVQAAAITTVRGHVFAAREKWAEAATCYQQAVDHNPADPALRNDLGYALLRQGATDRAIEMLRQANDLAPGDATIRNNLILALARGGQREAMARALDQIGDGRARADLRKQVLGELQRFDGGPSTATPQVAAAKQGR